MTRVKRLYLLNLGMEVVHTCSDVRYWFEVLCCTIPTHINDLEVKVMVVMDRKKKLIKFLETRGIQASYTILRQLLFILFLFRLYVTFNNLFIHIMTVSGYGRELNIVNALNANAIITVVT